MIFFYFILLMFGSFAIGWIVLGLVVNDKISLKEQIGLSFPVGMGLHSVVYYLVFSASQSIPNNLLVLLLELCILLLVFRFPRYSFVKVKKEKLGKIKKITKAAILIVALFALAYTLIQTTYWPIFETDDLKLFDFRALRLLEGSIDAFKSHGTLGVSAYYPPLTSLLHFFIYQIGGTNPRFLYGIFFLSFFFVYYGLSERILKSNFWGLVVATLITITPSVWWNSLVALPNTIYMGFWSMGTAYLFLSIKQNKGNKSVALAAMLLGLSAWARGEGFWMLPAVIYVLSGVYKRQFRNVLSFCLILLVLVYIWPISLKNTWTMPNNIIHQEVVGAIQQMSNPHVIRTSGPKVVLTYFAKPLFSSWNIIPIILIVVIAVQYLLLRQFPSLMQAVVLLSICVFLLSLLVFALRYPAWEELDSSVYRLSTMMIPIFWISIADSPVWLFLKTRS